MREIPSRDEWSRFTSPDRVTLTPPNHTFLEGTEHLGADKARRLIARASVAAVDRNRFQVPP
ncbi:hypothetical protein SAMN05444166_2652 [Singulisphaera sp. GP187]|nr:hypothetical protein SAMN05444166_2652 [Singulisphaera sp. GP187]